MTEKANHVISFVLQLKLDNLFPRFRYRAIPFLAEITAIMDWMYTGTSMSIGEWMKLWAIHAEVFEIKCWRVFEAVSNISKA